MIKSPFKFLDSYTLDDRNIFFGRDQEITELYRKVFESKILLVYGISGTGKSSLINCGLASRFDDSDWLPVNIRRGSNIINSLNDAFNKQALTPLKKEQSVSEKLQSIYLDHFKPVYLIFDQFEELFIFGKEEERTEFIKLIKEVIYSKTQSRIIFIIREEFLAGITEFEYDLPEIFMNRFRVEKMKRANAIHAIEGPCKVHNIETEAGFSEELIDKLCPAGNEIELTYLQIYLDRILRLALDVPQASQGKTDLSAENYPPFRGDTGGLLFTKTLLSLAGNVSDLLGQFLDEQIREFEDPDTGMAILKSFVSVQGTRRQMTETGIQDSIGAFGTVIAEPDLLKYLTKFVDLRILRERDEAGHFELRHDSLASKIYEKFTAIEKDIIEVRQFIENAWHNWEKRGILLSVSDLDYIAPYESRLYLSREVSVLIKDSKKELVRVRRRRRNIAVIATIALLVIFAGFTIWALREKKNALFQQSLAIESRNKAIESETKAVESRNKAIESELLATKAKELADKSEKQAVLEKNKAIESERKAILAKNQATESERIATQAKEIAEQERKIALDQKTKALAEKFNYMAKETVEADPTVALRLAEHAFQLDSTNKNIKNNIERIYYDNNFYSFVPDHGNGINSIVISPDGQRLLTASGQNPQLTDVKGNIIKNFIGHSGYITSLAFSPDGQKILTGSYDQTVRLWDLDGNIIKIFTKIPGIRVSAIFFPDGQKILTVSAFDSIRLWDLQGNLLRTLKSKVGPGSVVISPDGERILVVSMSSAQLLDRDGNLIQTFKEPSSSFITSGTYSPDGQKILTGSGNSDAVLWDLNGNVLQVFKGHSGQITSLAFSPDGQTVLTGSSDQTTRLWDLEGKILQIFKGHSSGITSVAFSPDGRNVLTLSEQKARWWNLPECYKYKGKPSLRILSIAFSPDGKKVIAGLSDNTATLCDLKGNIIQVFKGHASAVSSVAFSPDGQNILTGSYDRRVCLWDLEGNAKQVFNGHTNNIISVAFSPDGKRILTGAQDSTVRIWDLKGTIISVFRFQSRVFNVAFLPDGQRILVGLSPETKLLDLKGSTIKVFQSPKVVLSPDGKKLLRGTGQEVQLLSMDDKVLEVFKGHTDFITTFAFSPDGQKVITGSQDQTVRLWDLDGSLIQAFKLNSGFVSFVTFSPDGQHILATTRDQKVFLLGIKMSYDIFQKEGQYEQLSFEQKMEYGISAYEEIYELNDVDKLSEAAQWYYMRSSNLIDDKKNEYLNNYLKLTEKAVSIKMKSIFLINQKKDIKLTDLIEEIDQYFKIYLIDPAKSHFTEIDSVFTRINQLKNLDFRQLLISLCTMQPDYTGNSDLKIYLSYKIISLYEEQSKNQDFKDEELIITNVVNSYGGLAMSNLHSGQFKAALELAQKGYKIKQAFSIASDYCLSLLYNERIEDVEPVVSKQKQNTDTFVTFRSQALNGLISEEGRGHKAKYADKFRDILNK